MPLTFLCAGCSSDERDVAEASVKAALGERARNEAWVVSLVKAGPNWSVTLDGPQYRALSFVAPAPSLGESILERLGGSPGAAPPASPPVVAPPVAAEPRPGRVTPAPAPETRPGRAPAAAPEPTLGLGSTRDRHECLSCRRAFVVIYEVEGDEDQEMVSIACPHCWQTNHVLIAEAAAYTQAFRAEKLEA